MEATATEMKNNFGQYLEEVMTNGNDVMITRNGKKVARLTPFGKEGGSVLSVKENAFDYNFGKKKVSYEEFLAINEQTSMRLEYIDGEISAMSSPNVMHQVVLNRINNVFQRYFESRSCQPFVAPFDIYLKKKNQADPDVVQPDLLIICDLEISVNEAGRYMGIPNHVVEIVSESTRSKDMVEKLNSYMLSGVKEYWIIDTKYNKILVYEFIDAAVERMKVVEKGECNSFYFDGLAIDSELTFAPYKE